MFNINEIRNKFPLYKSNPSLIYLDSSATSLKPQAVLDKMNEYYTNYGVSINRGVYELGYKASKEYELARQKVSKFINAKFEEIIFTSGTTDSLNKLALMYGEQFLNKDDIVITSELEHHSSILPWMEMCKKKDAKLSFIELDEYGRISVANFKKIMNHNVKVVALTYVSNVLGYITPIKEIIKIAHEYGAVVIVDAAQAVPHLKIDVVDLDCDFLAFSAHKMFGPTGAGVLYGKSKHLKKLAPLYYGGDMNEDVYKDVVHIKDIPYRFEAGTPMIAEVIGFGAAIDFIDDIGYDNIKNHCDDLNHYLYNKISDIEELEIYNKNADIGIFSFNIKGVHPHDAATCFDEKQICLRAGHHCAQLVTRWLNCVGTLRASFYIYNDKNDIDIFVETIKEVIELFKKLEGENNE